MSILTALRQRAIVKRLLREGFGDIVHEPTPVSPKQPSFMWGFDKPVVIGPMNGGMDFPPAFKAEESLLTRALVRFGRFAAGLANMLIRGKCEAALLLCANERTLRALPASASKRRAVLSENGVDLTLWSQAHAPVARQSVPTFVFLGRLVDWKATDILLEAMAIVVKQHAAKLVIIGDGPQAASLKSLAARLEIEDHVDFQGFIPQTECAPHLQNARALLLPSLYECGGAVVLEAMCAGRPVIATNWGGPSEYLNEHCGVLVEPVSREHMIAGFAQAMLRLAADADLADRMGSMGQQRVREHFDWECKIDVMLEHYRSVIDSNVSDSTLDASAA